MVRRLLGRLERLHRGVPRVRELLRPRTLPPQPHCFRKLGQGRAAREVEGMAPAHPMGPQGGPGRGAAMGVPVEMRLARRGGANRMAGPVPGPDSRDAPLKVAFIVETTAEFRPTPSDGCRLAGQSVFGWLHSCLWYIFKTKS